MDLRIIKTVAAFEASPDPAMWQSVSYWQPDGQAVIDYMTTAEVSSPAEAAALHADAIMVAVFDGQKMVYAKPPPKGFVFRHHYASTEVVPDPPPELVKLLTDPKEP